MNLFRQNRLIGRRHPWIVILDTAAILYDLEVDIGRRIYFYIASDRKLVESYRINSVQFVRIIGQFSDEFQVTHSKSQCSNP